MIIHRSTIYENRVNLTSKSIDEPHNEGQKYRKEDATRDGYIDAPVFRAEFQIAGQFEQPDPTQKQHQDTEQRNNHPR